MPLQTILIILLLILLMGALPAWPYSADWGWRQTEQQAETFATKVKERVPCSGDPYQRIMGWLLPALPSREGNRPVQDELVNAPRGTPWLGPTSQGNLHRVHSGILAA